MSGLGKHGLESDSSADSVVTKVARTSLTVLREGEKYDYQDREGQWHNVLVSFFPLDYDLFPFIDNFSSILRSRKIMEEGIRFISLVFQMALIII